MGRVGPREGASSLRRLRFPSRVFRLGDLGVLVAALAHGTCFAVPRRWRAAARFVMGSARLVLAQGLSGDGWRGAAARTVSAMRTRV